MINPELLNILACPETKQRVTVAQPAVVEALNAKIASGAMKNRAGSPVTQRIDSALIREDGRFAYPVRKNIPVMLVDESLPV